MGDELGIRSLIDGPLTDLVLGMEIGTRQSTKPTWTSQRKIRSIKRSCGGIKDLGDAIVIGITMNTD